jgi:hypothetical protein
MQTPEQAPPSFHCPVPSQVCGTLPLHFFAPGTQTPTQLPLSQTKGQSEPLVQLPPLSQVCGVLFMHRFAGGRQTPPHMPMLPEVTHTFGQAWLLTQAPCALQSC